MSRANKVVLGIRHKIPKCLSNFDWAYDHDMKLDFSRLGKPTDNPYIELFNTSLRNECLNVHWFLSLADARTKFETWHRDYNGFRLQQSLDGLSLDMYLDAYHESRTDSLLLTG